MESRTAARHGHHAFAVDAKTVGAAAVVLCPPCGIAGVWSVGEGARDAVVPVRRVPFTGIGFGREEPGNAEGVERGVGVYEPAYKQDAENRFHVQCHPLRVIWPRCFWLCAVRFKYIISLRPKIRTPAYRSHHFRGRCVKP